MNELGYELLDLDVGRKLERFGEATVVRPDPNAKGRAELPSSVWQEAHAEFVRKGRQGKWEIRRPLPEPWIVRSVGVEYLLEPAAAGQVGFFADQEPVRVRMDRIVEVAPQSRVLDLFGASGGSSLVAARRGAKITYVDAARSAVARARRNFEHNGLEGIRSIAEDVRRFARREVRRGSRYEGIVLDPPSFGRGPKGEIWKIERDLDPLLEDCRRLLPPSPAFLALTLHTTDWVPDDLRRRVDRVFGDLRGETHSGELGLSTESGRRLPCGLFAFRDFV